MGMGKFGQGDPTKTQHQISSSNTGTHHLAGDLVIEGDLSVSGSTTFASGGGARSVAGDTDNGVITWKTSDNTFIVESGVLVTADGHLSSSGKGYFEKDVEIADNLLVSGSITAGSGVSIPDDQTLTFGTNNDVTVEYDEDGNDVLLFNNGVRFQKDQNGATSLFVKNDTNGTAAEARIQVQSTTGQSGFTFSALSDNYAGAISDGAGKAVLHTDTGADALAFMSRNTSATSEVQFYTQGAAAANKRVVITADGHLSASQKLYVEKDVEIADNLLVSGSVTLGNAASDVTTVTGRLSASEGMFIPDDKKLFFGTTDATYIEKDEDSAFDDLKVWSGANGMRVVSNTASQPNFQIVNIKSDDANGPQLTLFKYRLGAAADNDQAGTINFKGLNSSNSTKIYASLAANVSDVTNGTEDSSLTFSVMEKGSTNAIFVLGSNSITMGTGSASVQLKGRLSQSFDGQNSFVGSIATEGTLDVSGSVTFDTDLAVGTDGVKITKSTTNGTLNFGTNNNNNGGFDAATGDMNARAGTVIGQVDTTDLTQGSLAYGNVVATGVLATDAIVATSTGGFIMEVNRVETGRFSFTAKNDTGSTITAHASNSSAQIKFNWVAL